MINLAALQQTIIKSGQPAPVAGYYVYDGNATPGQIPCMPTKDETIIELALGQRAPVIESCKQHEAYWKLITEIN